MHLYEPEGPPDAVAEEAGERRLDGRPELPAALTPEGLGAGLLRGANAVPRLALGGVPAGLIQRAVRRGQRLAAALRAEFGFVARVGDPLLDLVDFGVAVARELGL